MPSAEHTPWRSSSLRNTRSRVIAVCNEEHVPVTARQVILNEIAELEHLLRVAEDAALEAESRRRAAATRSHDAHEVLEAVERVLRDGRQAEVARRALHLIERHTLQRSA